MAQRPARGGAPDPGAGDADRVGGARADRPSTSAAICPDLTRGALPLPRRQRRRGGGALPERRLPGLRRGAGAEARRLHDAGFWHRDLSGGNVLLRFGAGRPRPPISIWWTSTGPRWAASRASPSGCATSRAWRCSGPSTRSCCWRATGGTPADPGSAAALSRLSPRLPVEERVEEAGCAAAATGSSSSSCRAAPTPTSRTAPAGRRGARQGGLGPPLGPAPPARRPARQAAGAPGRRRRARRARRRRSPPPCRASGGGTAS